jgi:hypothetical protein
MVAVEARCGAKTRKNMMQKKNEVLGREIWTIYRNGLNVIQSELISVNNKRSSDDNGH